MTTIQSHVGAGELSTPLVERSLATLRTFGAGSLQVLLRAGEGISRAQIGFEARMGSMALSGDEIQTGADHGTLHPKIRDRHISRGDALPYFEAHPDRHY